VNYKILLVNVLTLWPALYARLFSYFKVFLIVTLRVCYFVFFLTYTTQTLDVQDIDSNCQAAVKTRLPYKVKQELAKVARLSVMFCHTILYMSETCFLLLTACIVPYMHITLLRFEYCHTILYMIETCFLLLTACIVPYMHITLLRFKCCLIISCDFSKSWSIHVLILKNLLLHARTT
jgi:hypothetical protein